MSRLLTEVADRGAVDAKARDSESLVEVIEHEPPRWAASVDFQVVVGNNAAVVTGPAKIQPNAFDLEWRGVAEHAARSF
ncbi:MAG TPA: hypothetical protein VKP00_05200 [Gemmatimonadaceae bacterium]|nr:hypothetical protein [Gemmatimonadaceae bacterium]